MIEGVRFSEVNNVRFDVAITFLGTVTMVCASLVAYLGWRGTPTRLPTTQDAVAPPAPPVPSETRNQPLPRRRSYWLLAVALLMILLFVGAVIAMFAVISCCFRLTF